MNLALSPFERLVDENGVVDPEVNLVWYHARAPAGFPGRHLVTHPSADRFEFLLDPSLTSSRWIDRSDQGVCNDRGPLSFSRPDEAFGQHTQTTRHSRLHPPYLSPKRN